jgi:hypothetical protein
MYRKVGAMPNVFVSFIHEEKEITELVLSFLRKIFGDGVEIFLSADQTTVYAGDNWMDEILSALKDTKVLVSLLSPTSIGRPWINFEAGAAWMREAKVIPVCFRGLTIGELPKPYSSLQAIEMGSTDAAYYLASSIAHHLNLPEPRRPRPSFGFERVKALMGGGRTVEEWDEIDQPYDHFISKIKTDRKDYEQWLDAAEDARAENLPE